MATLLATVLITALLFTGAVVSVKFLAGKTFEESAVICRDTILKIGKSALNGLMTPTEKTTTYPIYIGYIDGCLFPERVEHYFKDLREFYKIMDFDVTFSFNSNVTVYRFSCVGLKQDIEEKELIIILHKISTLALKKHFQDNGYGSPTVTCVQNLVAVELNGNDMLSVYLARTNHGLADIQQIQKRVRDSYLVAQKKSEDLPLIEDWEEDFWN
ncbi:hypothetical protein [Lacrimispora indolis]|uniref:hypothetical protein n=1 Tax=Lacrimispora indolis TaxID=69825 RepID=UPI000420C25D|nr:hypothetical protein [[Clostridium] methoxybenzovorans]